MRTFRISLIHFLVLVLICISCTWSKEDLHNRITKIDPHVHLRTDDMSNMEFTKAQVFRYGIICTQENILH